MREALFIKRNQPVWEELESCLNGKTGATPDRLAELYIQITDDLSYARTFYPDSRVIPYLNALAGRLHARLYKTKKEEKMRFLHFFVREIPDAVYRQRHTLLLSLVLFFLFISFGWISSELDPDFTELILGKDYVRTTIHNIKSGKPTDIYASGSTSGMFLGITINNIRVSFLAFALGILGGAGSIIILLYNGIMVGTFLHLFYKYHVFTHAILSVMMHGTIELLSIVIAAGAGFCLGRGMFFPESLPRSVAFMRHAKDGIKLIIGLMPMFVLAGFIEGFLTRLGHEYPLLAATVILLSLGLIIAYFVIIPLYLNGTVYAVRAPESEFPAGLKIQTGLGILMMLAGLGILVAAWYSPQISFGVLFIPLVLFVYGAVKMVQGVQKLKNIREKI